MTIEAIGVDQVALRWGATASGQKLEGFVAVIKHSSKTDGSASWANSSILRKVEARTTSVVLPLLNGEYLIKFQNEQRLRSASAVSAIINIPDGIPRLNHEVFREDQLANEFGGDKVGVYYNQDYDGFLMETHRLMLFLLSTPLGWSRHLGVRDGGWQGLHNTCSRHD